MGGKMKGKEYQVWECKIVVSADESLPDGFDGPPRQAAINAVEKTGIEVIACFSGWGGALTEIQRIITDGN